VDGLGVGARDEGTEHRVLTGPAPLGEGVALGLLFASATSCLVRAEVANRQRWSITTTTGARARLRTLSPKRSE